MKLNEIDMDTMKLMGKDKIKRDLVWKQPMIWIDCEMSGLDVNKE